MNSMKLEDHGFSYKIAFLEWHIEKLIEGTQNYKEDRVKILKAVKLLSPWIFTLQIKINCPDINIEEISHFLYNVIHLKVRCTEGKILDYKKKIVGMKFTEARDIAESLKNAQNLVQIIINSAHSQPNRQPNRRLAL